MFDINHGFRVNILKLLETFSKISLIHVRVHNFHGNNLNAYSHNAKQHG